MNRLYFTGIVNSYKRFSQDRGVLNLYKKETYTDKETQEKKSRKVKISVYVFDKKNDFIEKLAKGTKVAIVAKCTSYKDKDDINRLSFKLEKIETM